MTVLRVGIIGCGRISDLHVLSYRGRDDAAITALCDTVSASASAAAQRWELPRAAVFDDYRALCGSGLVDLVEIIVPHHLHYEIAAFALECDLHVSMQKPLSLRLADADKLVAAAAASSRTVRLYENFLFYPPVLKAVELVCAGLVGEPLTVRLKSNAGHSANAWEVPLSAQQWRHNPDECGGGPLVFDDGHHKFSLAWVILGQPAQVHAWIGATQAQSFEIDSPSLVSMRYPSGALASLEMVYSAGLLIEGTTHYAQDDRMEITGTEGVIWVNRGHGRIGNQPPVASYRDGRFEAYDCATGWEHSFIGATASLLDGLTSGQQPILAVAEGRDVLAAALAAQESAASGSAVSLEAPIGRSPESVRRQLVAAAQARSATSSRVTSG